MGRSPSPPLTKFSRQLISFTLDRLADAGRDASGRWLAAQIEMSHNYVAKRLRFELPFSTTDVERIARAFGMSPLSFVEAAVASITVDSEALEAALAAERRGDWQGLALAAHAYDDESEDEHHAGDVGDGV